MPERFAKIAMRFGIIGVDCQRIAETLDGILQQPVVAQRSAEIEMAARIGVDGKCLAVVLDGIFQFALHLQYRTQVAVGFIKTRLDGNGLAISGNCFFPTVERLQCDAEVETGDGEAGLQADSLAVALYGFFGSAQIAQHDPEIEVDFGDLVIECDGLAVDLCRFRVLALALECYSQHVIQHEHLRVLRDHAPGVAFRLRQLAAVELVDQGLHLMLRRDSGLLHLHFHEPHQIGFEQTAETLLHLYGARLYLCMRKCK